MRAMVLLVSCASFAGCGNTYHPEYHPVTVTKYEQHVAYPASGQGVSPAPTLIASPPPAPPTPAPWSAWPDE